MINELVKAASSMKDAGITPENWHPKLKALPKASKKSPCLRVWLTDGGHVKDIELLRQEQVVQLRKYEPDLGKSLPGFNVRPLYRIVKSDDEIRNSSRGQEGEKLKIEWTKEFLYRHPDDQSKDDFWNKTRKTLCQCFGRVCEDLKSIYKDELTNDETLVRLLDAVSKIDVDQFQKEYSDAVRYKVKSGELPLLSLCYFVTVVKKREEDENSRTPVPTFSVFLDIKNYAEYPVADRKTMVRLNALLINRDNAEGVFDADDNSETDAYGLDTHQKEKKFPGVTLPFLGGVILRSQAKTIPAQKRYHQCESETFPVGVTSRQRVKAALEWLSSIEHDGETYGVAGDNELLFAYPKVLPKNKIPLAMMVGAQPDINLQTEKFELIAKSVIEQLKGLGRTADDAEIEIFSLRKTDKARTKVVYYRNVTVASLEAASFAWHDGCQNIPMLDIRDWSDGKRKEKEKPHPIRVEYATIFPIKLHRFLNTVWKRNGDQAGKVKAFQPSDGLKLLLDVSCTVLASYMMQRFMLNAQGYFLHLCRTHCRVDKKGRQEISNLPDKKYYPGILGLLLFKLGKGRDKYMKESAFLLGRCLRVADEVHRLYCEVVRNDLPPELCGSSLLVGMMESPSSTLSQLALRSAPYVKWGRGGSDKGDKGGLVWYWLRQWEEINDQLRALEWPKRMTPDERAQVFLGYLSKPPKKDNSVVVNRMDSIKEGE